MVRDLITQPLRVAALTTRVGVHVAIGALTVTERLVELAARGPVPYATRRSFWSVEVRIVPAQDPPAEPPAERAADERVVPSEPWKGYAHMNAHDVIHRLSGASAEEASVVECYERNHGRRKTVLTAAERHLSPPARAASAANGAGPR
jgi:hypothetical protein